MPQVQGLDSRPLEKKQSHELNTYNNNHNHNNNNNNNNFFTVSLHGRNTSVNLLRKYNYAYYVKIYKTKELFLRKALKKEILIEEYCRSQFTSKKQLHFC